MNFYIQQCIQINYIKIGGITNSSVLQIGSAGIIKPQANLYNTGGFTQPAPSAHKPFGGVSPTGLIEGPAVPLQAPVRRLEKEFI
ncbi:putative spore germination protein GerPB [Neobacillus rhizosphaerae]|uniref:Spore germination protein GerPB n=1 Tax=Neobacillus rhizosphaerae TaxID=2880965 RepID=A0ABM9ELQ4_9BACI|nr:spore germination protein GerPB [Neobacillus rhizosphaerae]CAH2713525.1 putative spore germination protein GerPB [Neobacillus rhizosphaerae]